MYDFCRGVVHILQLERNRPFHTVQVVIQTGFWIYEQRSGNAEQIQPFGQLLLKKVFYGFDGDLCVMQVQCRDVACGMMISPILCALFS